MAEDREEEENVIESEEATAGGPSTHDATGTRLRAETPGMLPPDELDRRQERIRTERKTGGPDVRKKATGAAARDVESEDVAPTETEPPPSSPPEAS